MPSTKLPINLFSIFSVIQLVSGQMSGVGRFPCSTNSGGVVVPNPSICTSQSTMNNEQSLCIVPNYQWGTVDLNGFKNYGAVPTSAECFQDYQSGDWFCGIAGASCQTDSNCDNGHCSGGVCTGARGSSCTKDSDCTGSIYCSSASGEMTGTCAGTGTICDDGCIAGDAMCLSGSCDMNAGECNAPAGVTITCTGTNALAECLEGAAYADSCCVGSDCAEIYADNEAACNYVASESGTCTGSATDCCDERFALAFPIMPDPCA